MKKVSVCTMLFGIAVLLGAGVAWAVCGVMSLASIYPLGVDMAGDGWIYQDIEITSAGGIHNVELVSGQCVNVDEAEVRLDDSGDWVDITSGPQPYSISSGTHTWNFRTTPANFGNAKHGVCIYIMPSSNVENNPVKRFFGWKGCY